MSTFDPGDGWREVREGDDDLDGGRDFITLSFLAEPHHSHHTQRTWVREEPVPPLPPLPTEIATLDGADLIFVSEVLRALGTWKRALK